MVEAGQRLGNDQQADARGDELDRPGCRRGGERRCPPRPVAGPGECVVLRAEDDLVGQIDQSIVVETTIDPKLQSVAEAAIIDELAAKSVKFNVTQGALVAMTPEGAVRFGVATAAISVTRPGTAPAMPSRAEIDALL